VVVALVQKGLTMPSDIYFSLMDGLSPFVVVKETVEIKCAAGSLIHYFINPGKAFCGTSFEDMAREKSGRLVFDAAGCASIAVGYAVGKLGLP
jgi:hypothetical protein